MDSPIALCLCVRNAENVFPRVGRIDPSEWDVLRIALAEALNFAKGVGEVKRDEEARRLWREVYGELSEGKPGLAGALLARAEANLCILPARSPDRSATIQAPHLLAALALLDYSEKSVRFIFGDCLGDDIADEVLRLLRGCPDGMTRTELSNYFQNHVPANGMGKAWAYFLSTN